MALENKILYFSNSDKLYNTFFSNALLYIQEQRKKSVKKKKKLKL